MISMDDVLTLIYRGVLGIWTLVGISAAHLFIVLRQSKKRRR